MTPIAMKSIWATCHRLLIHTYAPDCQLATDSLVMSCFAMHALKEALTRGCAPGGNAAVLGALLTFARERNMEVCPPVLQVIGIARTPEALVPSIDFF